MNRGCSLCSSFCEQGSRVTYGELDGNTDTWDANMLQGCYCDGTPDYNKTTVTGDQGQFVDYQCVQRACALASPAPCVVFVCQLVVTQARARTVTIRARTLVR